MNRQISIDQVWEALAILGFDKPETVSELTLTAGPYGGPDLPSRVGSIRVLHATSHVLPNSHLAFYSEAVDVISVHPFEEILANPDDKALLYTP